MLKNGLYNVLGTGIRVILTSITIPILIRLLGIGEYGLWTLISSVLDFSGLAHGGFSTATTYFLSKDLARNDDRSISQTLSVTTTAMFVLSSLIGITLLIFSSSIVDLFPKLDSTQTSVARSAMQFGSIVIWSRMIQQIPRGIGQACDKWGLLNILGFVQVVITNLGMIAILFMGGKILALVQWQAFSSFTMMVINFIVFFSFLKSFKLRFVLSKSRAVKIVKYSTSVWLTAIGGTLFQRGDRLIIGRILGTEALGIYSAITSIATQMHTFSSVAMHPILPRISNLTESHDNIKIAKQVKQAFYANCVIVILMSSLLLIFSDTILNFLFSASDNEQYTLLFKTIVIIYSCFSLSAVGHYTLQGIGKSNELFLIVLTSSIVSIMTIYMGALYGNLYGAALGNIGYVGILFSNIRVRNLLYTGRK